jgi:hypothetical protein
MDLAYGLHGWVIEHQARSLTNPESRDCSTFARQKLAEMVFCGKI